MKISWLILIDISLYYNYINKHSLLYIRFFTGIPFCVFLVLIMIFLKQVTTTNKNYSNELLINYKDFETNTGKTIKHHSMGEKGGGNGGNGEGVDAMMRGGCNGEGVEAMRKGWRQ